MAGTASAQQSEVKRDGLWGGIKIPILGVTGEKWSGKSIFVASIDPEGTLNIDLELSTESYDFPFKKRVSLYHELATAITDRQPTSLDCWIWFSKMIDTIKPGEYSVVAIDPVNDIEAGLAAWVYQNPEMFGHTKGQYDRSSGLLQGDISSYWKLKLGVLAAKIQTLAFTTHLGLVWGSDGRPLVGQTKQKGRPVLTELASLYLQLERKPNQKGEIPAKPVARVLKSRLMVSEFINGEMKMYPCLPGSVPDCDPNKIREYIANPVGKRQIRDDEKAVSASNLTDDERLLLKAQIIGEQLQVEQSKSSRLEMMKAAAQQVQQRTQAVQQTPVAMQPEPATATQQQASSEPVAEPAKRVRRTKEQIAADEAAKKAAASPEPSPATPQTEPGPDATAPFGTSEKPFNPAGQSKTVHQIVMCQFAELNKAEPAKWTHDNFMQALATKYGAKSVMELSPENAEDLRKKLWTALTAIGLNGDGDLSVGNS